MRNRRNRESDECSSAQWVVWGYILLWIALQGTCETMDADSPFKCTSPASVT